MWNRPHLLILDEPTNFLDRDSLGALSNAIRDFGGGVVMISHAEEFYKPLCSEQWLVEAGKLTCDGEAEEKKLKIGKKKREGKSKGRGQDHRFHQRGGQIQEPQGLLGQEPVEERHPNVGEKGREARLPRDAQITRRAQGQDHAGHARARGRAVTRSRHES